MTINYKSWNCKEDYTIEANEVTIGTEKQIDWANDLKATAIQVVMSGMERIKTEANNPGTAYGKPGCEEKTAGAIEQCKEIARRLDAIQDAKVFIDARTGWNANARARSYDYKEIRAIVLAHKLV